MATPRRKAPLSRTQALAALVERTLLPDLKARAAEPEVAEALRERWEYERTQRRTAATLEEWTGLTLTQVAVAWALSAVFVRVLEDRGLTEHRRLAGGDATDSEVLFLEMFPGLGAREYVWTAFAEVARAPVAQDLLGPRGNPSWRLGPSHEAVRAMLDHFREADADGTLRWRYDDVDTRILGDLYQDLSAEVRERYALLQTPDFVERFILDRTLEPAIAHFGLQGFRVIDPTCGSGHFLLGAFHRLLGHLERARPGVARRELAAEALSMVYGSDVNPYAVAIARFRLMLAYLEACGVTALAEAPALPSLASHVVVADSLLLGTEGSRGLMELALTGEEQAKWGPRGFDFADPVAVNGVFRQRFHAVVGNPPYIICRDSALREVYREGYPNSAGGKFALAAPFTERFFKLAVDDGYVGLINANSFMKREFGKGLVEKVLPRLDLTHVVDTSGAFIPGHGTPTVILFGRHRRPDGEKVRVVMGRRGEPETPTDPAKGRVWSTIADNIASVGFENEFVTVANVPRTILERHPWSLGGGGTGDLKMLIENQCSKRLFEISDAMGFDAIMGEDDLFVAPQSVWLRLGASPDNLRELATGDVIRDWFIATNEFAIFPYDDRLEPKLPESGPLIRCHFWSNRRPLIERRQFGKNTLEAGLKWFEYRSFYKSKRATPLAIGFAFVASHNHFALDRGVRVFKQSAPIIKLPANCSEEEHLALIAWMNSSSACFWMKQVCFPKTSGTNVGDVRGQEHRIAYEFSSTAVGEIPIPSIPEVARWCSTRLHHIASKRIELAPESVLREATFRSASELSAVLHDAAKRDEDLFGQMVALQEEIDWIFYVQLGLAMLSTLTPQEELATRVVPMKPGARTFLEDSPGGDGTAGGSVMTARRKALRADPNLRILEDALYKRPWFGVQGVFHRDGWTYDERARVAMKGLALELIELEIARDDGRPKAVGEIVAALHQHPKFEAIIEYLNNAEGLDLATSIIELLAGDSVPYLAAMRHTDDGLLKRAQWEHTWALQRREDAGEVIADIPVPPKYDQKDYRDPRYWSLRGKLDVPRERFISYPGAETDPRAPLFGWAGWDHLQRARALATLYNERRQTDGWDRDRLRPLLAGLQELVPWLLQWHDAPDPELDGQGHGRLWKEFVEAQRHELHWTEDDLRAWRPPTAAEKKAAKKAAKAKG